MKRLLTGFALAASLAFALLPGVASAQDDWRLDAFHADVDVRADGVVDVTETLNVDFLTERHGIYRYIPTRGKDTDGKAYSVTIDAVSVTRDGQPDGIDASRQGDNLVWRIGDPDVTYTGTHEYVIRYSVDGAIRRFTDFDELYWNVTGEGWDTPLPIVTATVTLPEGVQATQGACYTGTYGSTASDCVKNDQAGRLLFFAAANSGDPMTVAVGFPKGAVAMPSLAKRILAAVIAWGPWLLPLAVLVFCWLRWRKYGKDTPLGTLVVQYEAPSGLTPAETTALLTQNAGAAALAPTIVDLAARGYLKIEETDKKGLLGTSKSYALVKVKEWKGDAALRPFETKLLDDLFALSPDRVEISSLKNTFYPHVQQFTTGVMKSITDRGYFVGDPVKVRGIWVGVGIVIAFLGFFVGAAVGISGVIIAVFGYFMPKRSPEGVAAAAHAAGFKEFVSSVEKYRAPWMEDQNIFFKVLPFALAFGLGKKWAQAFSGLQMQPPNWYVGTNMATWSALSFNDDLSSWSKSLAATAVSRPSSGSGSGGGGFSGGGFGGGGGGSW